MIGAVAAGRRARSLVGFAIVAAGAAAHSSRGSAAGWALSGGAGVQEMWAQNTTYTAAPGNGDVITSLSLSGRALFTGPRARLDGYYAPSAQFYRDRPTLNSVSHTGRVTLAWTLSPRSTLTVSDQLSYTPEQGVSTVSFQSPVVFTRFTDRRANTAGASYRLSLGPRSALVTDVRRHFQSYSDPNRVDWTGTSSGLSLDRALGRRAGVQVGTAYAWNRFSVRDCDRTDPNGICVQFGRDQRRADVESAFTSVRYDLTRRAGVAARLGYNVVLPEDPTSPNRRGVQASTSLTWTGARVTSVAGYHRDISTGSGVLSLSRSESEFANVGLVLHPDLRADFTLNHTTTRSLGSSRNNEIDSFSGQTVLTWRLGTNFNATASFARHVQDSGRSGAPDLSSNRYAVGFAATFN